MSSDLPTRKALGKWLAAACSTDPMRPGIQGVIHAPDGWLYATDGHRVHAAHGLSDLSGRARCPWSTWWLDQEDVPDMAAVFRGLGDGRRTRAAREPRRRRQGRDLAMLVRCLASRLHKVAPGTSLAKRARDYLFRKGLAGSPLRAETAEPDVSEAASHE